MKTFDFKDRWALVTGASSGIGAEFARQLAANGTHLILTARRESALAELAEKLRAEFGIDVVVIPADLSQFDSVPKLLDDIRGRGLTIDIVINNAGLGSVTAADQADPTRMLQIVDVNVRALTELSYACLPDMMNRGTGLILNVASIVSFQPVTYMAVYAASKAYVLHLSEALAEEAAGSGVRVTALCPGTTKTEFFDSAGADGWIDRWGGLTPEFVVRTGLNAARRGCRVSVPAVRYQVMTFLPRLLPRRLLTTISKRLFRSTISEKQAQK
ncbi:SDR family NAD(P)-dependent oxidoreductase [Rubinisphaera margarita]|uniref:SDR family NAD(P)-dependent oxidoreductase n=1 Tax=Rubinisphaera margarita TaxID=2909586 RepID=UPI001EE8A0DC|nr:SDR family oxidoreductase [Rubinisphaera margarita]MCG6157002.1 SDR family oxidoreductase [Rubinisphaera margarita]